MSDLSEIKYLAELIGDFGAGQQTNPEKALKHIQTHFQVLEYSTNDIVNLLKSSDVDFKKSFETLTKGAHKYLFFNILRNAGEYRKKDDPENGAVYFGKSIYRNPSGSEFSGSPPDNISVLLSEAFSLLQRNDLDPIRSAITFYQKFVHIHPFYDANGRIARYIVTLYLAYYGYYVEWKRIDDISKDTFLKKLNQCHKRTGQPIQTEYLEHLYRYWKKFVIPIASFNS